MRCRTLGLLLVVLVFAFAISVSVQAAYVTVRTQTGDPYELPRPSSGETSVPLKTSYYIELVAPSDSDDINSNTIRVQVRKGTKLVKEILAVNQAFASGCSGWVRRLGGSPPATGVYVTTDLNLTAKTVYKTRVYATSKSGIAFSGGAYQEWTWTTESSPTTHSVSMAMSTSMTGSTTWWHGELFPGGCTPGFCYAQKYRVESWDKLYAAKTGGFPEAWDLHRDFWLTGFDDPGTWLSQNEPNAVRELETRHVYSIETSGSQRLVDVEDFYGHEQYGIANNRIVSGDYAANDVVLISDGFNFTTTTVVRVINDANYVSGTLVTTNFSDPGAGWKLAYQGTPGEDPKIPGLFPTQCSGGFLYKWKPIGPTTTSLKYYWGRIDRQLDTISTSYSMRVALNFADAPMGLSYDGRSWTKAKDNLQMRQIAIDMTRHIVDRYATEALSWYWGVFNEPDLSSLFWRCNDFIELQRFYDYVSDGILRAFEDAGYDSDLVKIGGLELGAIWGTNLVHLDEFLGHCSPNNNSVTGELADNAAYGDARLNGKRSQRVDDLCGANSGHGAPLDWISIHTYNASKLAADKLKAAMDRAIAIDATYYTSLSVCNFENVPNWVPPADYGARHSFSGNGYWSSWTADLSRRRLAQGTVDSRYSFGESTITDWQWVQSNFEGMNDIVRNIAVDNDSDNQAEYYVIVNNQIYNFVDLLSSASTHFYEVFPETHCDQYNVSGFASRDSQYRVTAMVYAHGSKDYQSRSDRAFTVNFKLKDWWYSTARVTQYQMDKFKNTYYDLVQQYRDRTPQVFTPAEVDEVTSRALLTATKVATVNRVPGDYNSVSTSVTLSANGAAFLVFDNGN